MFYDLIEASIELDKKPWAYFYHQTRELMANINNFEKGVGKILFYE